MYFSMFMNTTHVVFTVSFYINFAYVTEKKINIEIDLSVQGAAARQTVPVKLCIIVIDLGDV